MKLLFVEKKYELETLVEDYCKENFKSIALLRLPVAHSELNAIELIWAQVKREVARNNTTFKMKDVKTHMEKAMANVKPAQWKKAMNQVIKVENEYWKTDFLDKLVTVEPVVIELCGEESTTTDVESD